MLQPARSAARSAQVVYEEAFFALLLALHRRYPVANLALSGGCAMNSVANGKVYLRTPFRKMYLPAAAGDAGGAIGAACVVAAATVNRAENSQTSARDFAWVRERVQELEPTAKERRIDEIGWAGGIREAERLAKQNNRPVFLFTHDGRINTGRC